MINIGCISKHPEPNLALDGAKVLIVDDDPAVAKSIEEILAFEGVNSNSVNNGFAAIKELHDNKYQLVLLDLNIPDLDGEGVLNHINSNCMDTNVIVVSGETELKKAIRVLKKGAKDFIRKPYSPEELIFSVQNVLEKSNLERENQEILEKLEESNALHRFLVHNSPDLLFMLDCDGHFVFINNSTIKLLGYDTNEIIGKHYREIVHTDDLTLADHFFDNDSANPETQNQEIRLQGKDSETVLHVEIRINNVEKPFSSRYKSNQSNNNSIKTYGIARDISASKKAAETIHFQTHHDLLTGLPNRNSMNKRLASLISHANYNDTKFALLFININRFKLVNDTYGRCIGDKLLLQLAQTLRIYTRENDTLTRLGSDEFILLIDNISIAENAIAAAKNIVAATAIPFNFEGHEIHITTSIGIAIYPEHGESKESLVKNAATALCNAKTKSQSSHCLYHSKLNNNHSKTIQVENLIRNSIKNDLFVVRYQPQIDPFTGEVHAVEALVRIKANDGTLILPGKFIDVAEETSLINDIGEIVLEKVCRDKFDWNQKKIPLQVCINISAQQLAIDNFAVHVLEKVRSFQINPAEIEFELTENTLVKHMDKTILNISTLTDAGVKIAIDDFGTGYSSLSYLNQLPLNTLKLDKSFMQNITAENMNDTIIPAMISVSNGLQLDFIVEGVETKAQHEYLLQQGSCICQGFYYSRPINKSQLLNYISTYGLRQSH